MLSLALSLLSESLDELLDESLLELLELLELDELELLDELLLELDDELLDEDELLLDESLLELDDEELLELSELLDELLELDELLLELDELLDEEELLDSSQQHSIVRSDIYLSYGQHSASMTHLHEPVGSQESSSSDCINTAVPFFPTHAAESAADNRHPRSSYTVSKQLTPIPSISVRLHVALLT